MTTQAVLAGNGESSSVADHLWKPPPTAEQVAQMHEQRLVEAEARAARDVPID
ncbi:MAG: hypothetical protein AAF916_04175 [Planctomycetota bacterium]